MTVTPLFDTTRPAVSGLILFTNEPAATAWLRDNVGQGEFSGLFLRGGALVHVIELCQDDFKHPENGHLGFQQITHVDTAQHLLGLVSATTHRFAVPSGKDSPPKIVNLYPSAAANVLYTAHAIPNIRTLDGVTGTPIIRADGTILDKPGYDPATRLLYRPDEPDLAVPGVPEHPTQQHVSHARDVLLHIFADFPLEDEHHRANLIGALMLPLIRMMAPPPWKLIAVDAPTAGTGKSLAAEVIAIVHHGRRGRLAGGVMKPGLPQGEEFRKWLTTVLRTGGGGVVRLDNIRHTLAGDTLEGLLTSATYGDRLLGGNDEARLLNDRLWIVTGNRIQHGGDMARRIIWVRIDARMQNPEYRTGFAEADLPGWVAANRGPIIAAVLTLARSWYIAGAAAKETTTDGYARTTAVVRGILEHAGITGQFDPAHKEASQDDTDTTELLAALYSWQSSRSNPWWPASEMAAAGALRDSIPDHWSGGRGLLSAKSASRHLKKLVGDVREGLVLTTTTDLHLKIARFSVTER